MSTFEYFGYLMVWVTLSLALMIVWPNRWHNGYIMKGIRKITRGNRDSWRVWLSFWIPAYGLSSVLQPIAGDHFADVVYTIILFLQLLDDYLNGEDDAWKKRLDAVRNKVKWLMELPPQREGEVAS